VRLRPPLGPRVSEELDPLDAAALEDEARHEAVELTGGGAVEARHVTLAESRVRGTLAGARLADLHLGDTAVAGADLANLRAPKAALRRVAFDRVRLQRVELRGCRLDGINAVENLRGAAMPWEDIVGNAGLFAAAVGIRPVDEG